LNITLIAFQDEKRDRDGGYINTASCRILHPTTAEEAAVLYQELLLEADDLDHEEWEITVLLNGREAETDEELDLIKPIENPGQAALVAAKARRLEAKLREQRVQRERDLRANEEAKARRELYERQEYERLKRKFAAAS
jgi:hypothetical protein